MEQLSQMAWFSLFGAIWQTGYLLNRYTYTSNPSINLPTGPMKYKSSHWADFDADLSQAVLVGLSASSKTARGFTWHIVNKRAPRYWSIGVFTGDAGSRCDSGYCISACTYFLRGIRLLADKKCREVDVGIQSSKSYNCRLWWQGWCFGEVCGYNAKEENLQGVKPVVSTLGKSKRYGTLISSRLPDRLS